MEVKEARMVLEIAKEVLGTVNSRGARRGGREKSESQNARDPSNRHYPLRRRLKGSNRRHLQP